MPGINVLVEYPVGRAGVEGAGTWSWKPGQEPRVEGELVTDETIRAELARALAGHNAAAGSAARIERLLVLARPAGLDAGEITDKGYVNQRQVLANRAALVELLYAQPEPESPENPELPAGVVEAERTA